MTEVIVTIIVLLLGLGHLVQRSPFKNGCFLPTLSGVVLCTCGLIPFGYSLIDEIAIGLTIILVHGLRQSTSGSGQSRWQTGARNSGVGLHELIYTAIIWYFAIEAIRGIFTFEGGSILDNVRKLRWVAYFAFLLILPSLLARRPGLAAHPKALIVSIQKAGILYVSVYICTGLFYEHVLNLSRYEMQPGHSRAFLWGTTAYALFPVVLVFPLSLISLSSNRNSTRRLAIVSILLWSGASFYYASRATSIIIALNIILQAIQLIMERNALKVVVRGLLLTVLGMVFLILDDNREFADDIQKIWATVASPDHVENEANDLDRFVETVAAFRTISATPYNFLFGYGYRMSGKVIGLYLAEVTGEYSQTLLQQAAGRDWSDIGMEAAAAFMIDGGAIGATLVVLLHVATAYRIWRSRCKYRLLYIGCTISAGAWLFVIDIRDVILYFIMLMPHGILTNLCRDGTPSILHRTDARSKPIMDNIR